MNGEGGSVRTAAEFAALVLMAHQYGDGEGTETVATAHRELERGRKVGHWIWYVFPQRDGLGQSARSRRFAIRSLDELRALLDDTQVRDNLVKAFTLAEAALFTGRAVNLTALFGEDVKKVVSSATLFEHYLRRQSSNSRDLEAMGTAAQSLLAAGVAVGIAPCVRSLEFGDMD